MPLLGNRHLQTILGTWLPGPLLREVTREQLLELADGDRLVLHDSVPPDWEPGQPVAVLVHGLGGNHRSGYLQRLGRIMLGWGWRVVRVDLRGCGKGIALARKPYHAGCSDDIRAVVEEVHGWAMSSPIVLLGFSLGGNIILKLAGESAGRPVPGLARVIAVNPPIDLTRASDELALPRNRFYELHFVRNLVALVRERARHFPAEHGVRFPRRLSLRRFDDLYTAPRSGFRDAQDYYERASALPWVRRIDVPTLILTSRDDPLVPVETFLTLQPPAHIDVHIASGGGHLGFLGWDGAGGIRWADRRIVEWLRRDSNSPCEDGARDCKQ